MTTSQNPISVIDHDTLPQSVVVTTAFTINEGDLVFWDGVNFTARPLLEASDVASGGTHGSKGFMGAAGGANKVEAYGGDEPLPALPIYARATVFVNTTNAEKYKHFDFVTIGADAQTVTKSGANEANSVGVVILDPPATARPEQATPAPEEVEGGSGVRIRILILAKHVAAKNV